MIEIQTSESRDVTVNPGEILILTKDQKAWILTMPQEGDEGPHASLQTDSDGSRRAWATKAAVFKVQKP